MVVACCLFVAVVVCCPMLDAGCLLCVECRLLFLVARCALFVGVCCPLFVVCCI